MSTEGYRKCVSVMGERECASSPRAKRTRADIPWDVKVSHHAYFVPVGLAAVLGLLAWAISKRHTS